MALKVKLEEKRGVASGQVVYLKKHPDIVKNLAPEVNRVIQNILRVTDVAEVSPTDIHHMMSFMEKFGLLPRDALHLSVMQRYNFTDIASSDSDFDRVSHITRYAPEKD